LRILSKVRLALILLTLSVNLSNIEIIKDFKGGILEVNVEQIDEMLKRDRLEWEALTRILEAHPEESLHNPKHLFGSAAMFMLI